MEHVHVSIENVMGAFSHDIYSVCSEITEHTGACMHTVRQGFEIKSLRCELLQVSCLVTLVKLFYLSKPSFPYL